MNKKKTTTKNTNNKSDRGRAFHARATSGCKTDGPTESTLEPAGHSPLTTTRRANWGGRGPPSPNLIDCVEWPARSCSLRGAAPVVFPGLLRLWRPDGLRTPFRHLCHLFPGPRRPHEKFVSSELCHRSHPSQSTPISRPSLSPSPPPSPSACHIPGLRLYKRPPVQGQLVGQRQARGCSSGPPALGFRVRKDRSEPLRHDKVTLEASRDVSLIGASLGGSSMIFLGLLLPALLGGSTQASHGGPPLDCVDAERLCLLDHQCNSSYRVLEYCAIEEAMSLLGWDARKECVTAENELERSPLSGCKCHRGSKKEEQCLKVYWTSRFSHSKPASAQARQVGTAVCGTQAALRCVGGREEGLRQQWEELHS
ncbi:GFRA1 protein, partial [Polypterus senegalus]